MNYRLTKTIKCVLAKTKTHKPTAPLAHVNESPSQRARHPLLGPMVEKPVARWGETSGPYQKISPMDGFYLQPRKSV